MLNEPVIWAIKYSHSSANGPALALTCLPKVDNHKNEPSNEKWINASKAFSTHGPSIGINTQMISPPCQYAQPQRREARTSQMKVYRSCHLAFFPNNNFAPVAATI